MSLQHDGSDEAAWCSTATTSRGDHVIGHWGECPDSCLQCEATQGPGEGEACVFPFSWQGETYTQCQPWVYGGQWETDGELWCSTKTDQSGQHIEGNFGICSDVCPVDISTFVSTAFSAHKKSL